MGAILGSTGIILPERIMYHQSTAFRLVALLLLLVPCLALGQEADASLDSGQQMELGQTPIDNLGQEAGASRDSGDTAWILASTALVLFMTLPGLALFYGGLVHKRNVLSVLMQCFMLASLMTVLWLVCGYSLAFSVPDNLVKGEITLHSFIGNLDLAFMHGVDKDTLEGSIPLILHFAFQMTFFIITPALVVGAFPERIRFSGMLLVMCGWALLVYLPVCHAVWGGAGSLFVDWGVIDFAGGIVVHITAGVAALAACIYIGPRKGYGERNLMPHNLPMTVIGAGMLWVGWYGFNGGSALAADGSAAMAITVTQISASTAALVWVLGEWIKYGKPSMLGFATGAIAGLAAITPASGSVGPVGGLCIGAIAGILCWQASTTLKARLGYDDSLDVFGVHGVGGFLGTVLAAVFCLDTFGGSGLSPDMTFMSQLGVQLGASLIVIVYTLVVTLVLLKVVDALVGLRVSDGEETQGLDVASHGETAYND